MASKSAGVKYDLTYTLAKFLDKHLVRVLLQTLREAGIYDPVDLVKAEYDIISKTNMVDESADLYNALTEANFEWGDETRDAAYWEKRRDGVLQKLTRYDSELREFLDFVLHGPELARTATADKSIETLERLSNGKFGAKDVEKLFQYAMFLYEAGQYDSGIADLLRTYRDLAATTQPRKCREAKWGELAAHIWRRDWSSAEDLAEDLFMEFGDMSQNRSRFGRVAVQETKLERVTQRAWLLHWCLFIYFNNEEYFQLIDKFMMQSANMSAIQLVCPHLLRYLTVVHFTDFVCHNDQGSALLVKLGETLEEMKYVYSDPITETVRLYMIDSDFQGASAALEQSKEVMESDFFLRSLTMQWFANVRRVMFKKYVRLCSTIDLNHLNSLLHFDVVPPNTDAGEGKDVEDWVANIIRREKVDARIDLTNNLIHVRKGDVCVHQLVIDKTREIDKTKTKNLIHTIKSNRILS